MKKMLFVIDSFEPFLADFGSWAKPQSHGDGFIMPLGWESELTSRDIIYTVIEIEIVEEPLP